MGILVTVGSLCCAILYFRFPKIPMGAFLVSLTTLRYESVDVIVIPVVEACVGGVEGCGQQEAHIVWRSTKVWTCVGTLR